MDKETERQAMRSAEAGYKALILSAAGVLNGVMGGGPGLNLGQLEALCREIYAFFDKFSVPLILQNLQLVRVSKNYYNYHAVNVALLSLVIGQMLRRDTAYMQNLALIGLSSDFGMLRLPLNILQGNTKLTDDEFARMRDHTHSSEMLLERAGLTSPTILAAVAHHHERWDGSGYPGGLAGDAIPMEARIVTLADWYDAANAKRDYKGGQAKSPFDVLAELQDAAGSTLDPVITEVAVRGIAHQLVGRYVMLSDNSVGKVATINPDNLRYPDVIVVGRRVKTSQALHPVSLSSYIPLFG